MAERNRVLINQIRETKEMLNEQEEKGKMIKISKEVKIAKLKKQLAKLEK